MHHLFRILSAGIILILFSCAVPDPEMTVADFDRRLDSSITADSLPMESIELLEPYDSYFLALKAAEFGYYPEAVKLARYCWKNAGGFIGERAAELCIDLHLSNGNYPEAEFTACLASADYPDSYRLWRAVVEAEYWQRKDADVLDTLSQSDGYSESGTDGELQLFRAVSSFRLKTENWQNEWIKLFIDVPASEYTRRGWDYLEAAGEVAFSDFESFEQLFRAKYAQATGHHAGAVEAYDQWLTQTPGQDVTSTVLNDLESLFVRGGGRLEGARLLERHAGNRMDFIAAAARLYRRAGYYADAERCMSKVIDAREGELSDRELWYSLDIRIRRNLTNAIDSLDFYIERWNDPDYFADSLDSLCTALVGRSRWKSIYEIARKLEHSGPVSVYERCRYISMRAAQLGLIEAAGFEGAFSDIYYRILTGDSLSELSNNSDLQQLSVECTDPPVPANESEKFIDGMIRYGIGNILDEVRTYRDDLSEDFLVYCASKLASDGEYLDSIRMMYQFTGRFSLNGYRALYPDAYRSEIERVSKENGIPPQLMFALVWKESGFDHDIVSRSGAIGLSQLMPSTAEDVAGRQRRVVEDLTDPVENLELGAWYLNWLESYVGNTAAAVLSYNGGPGRVRGWLRNWPSLPVDLLYEAAPVSETHVYGKKVLEAAVIYGLLYYGVDADETLKIFQEK
ncbi:MAG: lytic transglycosylase domain-containing protein [Spirochaetales bacterium]|uniref:Lytic transglycosylase domain-containing protein n=1 Tax=Candidatus Thalassospirochaeta sargassi TaxID=3119039 RepID=A0AAJ1MKA3_9SPIO|nr:lytic transglycosylase domain-containing protein [Spirochaetales bacterium]